MLVLSAGKLGSEDISLWNSLAEEFRTCATFFRLGELDESQTSLYFSALDYGLTAYPAELIGKSGSVAAMREHGLPVITCGSFVKRSNAVYSNNHQKNILEQSWSVMQSGQLLLQLIQANQS